MEYGICACARVCEQNSVHAAEEEDEEKQLGSQMVERLMGTQSTVDEKLKVRSFLLARISENPRAKSSVESVACGQMRLRGSPITVVCRHAWN